MKLKELYQKLAEELQKTLEPQGFILKGKTKLFRKTPTGFNSISLIIDDFSCNNELKIETELMLSIRIDHLEDLLKPYRDATPLALKTYPTHSVSIGQLLGDYTFRLIATSQEGLDLVTTHAVELIRKEGLSFFNGYSTIEALDRLYNDNPKNITVKQKHLIHRVLVRLGLAKLCKRRDWKAIDAELRAEFKLNQSREAKNFYTEKYDMFVNDLFLPEQNIL